MKMRNDMKKYLVIKSVGNGYFCGCCRRTDNDHEVMEFENDQEAKEYAERMDKDWRKNDVMVESIYALREDTKMEENGETWFEENYEVFKFNS